MMTHRGEGNGLTVMTNGNSNSGVKYEFETHPIKRYPMLPSRALWHSAFMGKEAFDAGKRYAIERRSKYTQEEINNFLNNPPASDDYTRGFMEGLRA